MEITLYSETSAHFYQTTRSHICQHLFPFRIVCKCSFTRSHCAEIFSQFLLRFHSYCMLCQQKLLKYNFLLTFSHQLQLSKHSKRLRKSSWPVTLFIGTVCAAFCYDFILLHHGTICDFYKCGRRLMVGQAVHDFVEVTDGYVILLLRHLICEWGYFAFGRLNWFNASERK